MQSTQTKPKTSQSAPANKSRRTSKPAKADDNVSESAKKAIAAVAAVVAKLPANEALLDSGKITKMQEGAAWGMGGSEKEPPSHGSVDYPHGHPDCLSTYTIVISGVLESMMRQDAVDFVKRHGGRVTSAVSSKTSFLLCGTQASLLIAHKLPVMLPCQAESCYAWHTGTCVHAIGVLPQPARVKTRFMPDSLDIHEALPMV